jgi:hypothetical protein
MRPALVRPRLIGTAACVSLVLLFAVAAWPASTGGTRTYSTGPFVVNCTSTGQVCSPPKTLKVTPPRHGKVTSVRYTTSPQHCSAIAIQVVRNGHVLATSGRLEAGEHTEKFSTSIPVPKGPSTLGFRAKGFPGGCNAGALGSWGGSVTVTVTLARRRH